MKSAVPAFPLALVLVLGVLRPSAWADNALPQFLPADRYVKMADRSPFAPPTPSGPVQVAAALPPGPKWSDDLVVTLLTQQGSVYFATIQNKAKNERFLLQSNAEDLGRQLALASVEWGELANQTTVMLRHNREFASVHFDPNAAAAPAANPLSVPGRTPIPGTYPAAAGTPLPGHLQPPPLPPGAPNVLRRQALIRTTPTVAAPPVRPPPKLRRPLSGKDDDNDG